MKAILIFISSALFLLLASLASADKFELTHFGIVTINGNQYLNFSDGSVGSSGDLLYDNRSGIGLEFDTSAVNGFFNASPGAIEMLGPNLNITKVGKVPSVDSVTDFYSDFYSIDAFKLFAAKDGFSVHTQNGTYAAFVVTSVGLANTGAAETVLNVTVSYYYNANGSTNLAERILTGCSKYLNETACYDATFSGASCYWDFFLEACNEASGSSGGGGGGGGATVSSNFASKSTRFWDIIPANEQKVFAVKSTKISVTTVSFSLVKEGKNVEIEVGVIKELPENIPAPDVSVYQHIQINHGTIENSDINGATVEFSVTKTWLAENSFNAGEVSLYRFDNSWKELSTRVVSTDAESVHYSATSPGLSVFAIGAKAEAPVEEIVVEEIVREIEEPETIEAAEVPQVEVDEDASKVRLYIILTIIVVIVAFFVERKAHIEKLLFRKNPPAPPKL